MQLLASQRNRAFRLGFSLSASVTSAWLKRLSTLNSLLRFDTSEKIRALDFSASASNTVLSIQIFSCGNSERDMNSIDSLVQIGQLTLPDDWLIWSLRSYTFHFRILLTERGWLRFRYSSSHSIQLLPLLRPPLAIVLPSVPTFL